MKILIVDDTEVMLLLISRFVEAMGHQVVLARNGQQGVDAFLSEQPDVVLMDMIMPVMDGPQAAKLIKLHAGGKWTPVVFVTAVGEENKLAEAIEQGADDYLTKPINFRVLEAKIKAIERTVNLNKQVWDQSAKLSEYYDRAEDEKRVARHLMDQMVNTERLSDPQLQYWLSSAESLSGDLIAVARTPGKVLHVLLADGIGHGLTAALNVLPLTQPFYTMTEKGFPMQEILIEMNNKIRQVLPVGRFVALALVAIDNVNKRMEVWNGGIPELQLIDQAGKLTRSFPSRNLPLGILPTASLEVATENYYIDGESSLFICSDGLIEARNRAGELFGHERLIAAAGAAPISDRLESLTGALTEFLEGESHHDDVSVIMVHLGKNVELPIRPELDVADLTLFGSETDESASSNVVRWRHVVMLGAHELRYINAVPFVMTFLDQIRELKSSQSDVFLILTELFVNALDHGLLRLSSDLKQGAEGMEAYLVERASRLALLQEGTVEIELAGVFYNGRKCLRIRVKDSGPGFDWQAMLDTSVERVPGRAFGRGVSLVKALCGKVEYRDEGSEVVCHYLPSVEDIA